MSNRLSMERSPYLIQHADNPVDWRPWNPEVFEEAQRLDKPVFLSIGYSTCHWCHVMAHESFEDEETAQAINAAFLPIKVDREERPDVDAVYMEACLAMNGSGGWPLTVLLTPEQKPFWAGTYLPKPQLLRLAHETARLWQEDRAGVLAVGETLTAHLRQETENRPEAPGRELVRRAVSQLAQGFDARWGGFGSAPKFPAPHNLMFLLRYAKRTGDGHAEKMTLHTLDAIYRGGLFDHVGGGFPGTPPMGDGSFPTLKKCSMTTLCWPWPMRRRSRTPAVRSMNRSSAARWTMCCGSCPAHKAVSAAAKTRTAAVWKGSITR